jgi:hypothetical protein
MSIKKQNSHTSARKKASAPSTSPRAKKAAAKASKRLGKSKTKERPAWLKKRDELTLKMFQEIYEDYQQGKFRRIL